ncbi:MAG TPA: type I restriction endonuclease subunit R, partial [Clostridiales bacterium]|nr:type I restriction endonuclease subunit R [Clostridiales bacterium]
QGLIQAYSRTNRVYGKSKEFGSIINFKYPAITEELVNNALKLYGSGGKSSPAIVEHYKTAVEKFAIKVKEMKQTLNEPKDWELLKTDIKAKELFVLSFRDSNEQLRLVTQYYEFKWDDTSFKIDEHTWIKYVGAYKNLTYADEEISPDVIVNQLVGNTKLSGTQVIDAHHILKLIGSKVKPNKGIQTVDRETLRIIYEDIQELSDVGENAQAQLLKEFVDTELITGNLSSELTFDESFEMWKQKRIAIDIKEFAIEWGLDEEVLSKSVDQFSVGQKGTIPYIDELTKSASFYNSKNQSAGNQLTHIMNLVGEGLPEWFIEIKQRYK